MSSPYFRGAVLAGRSWWLALVLWGINALFGVAFALASGHWLSLALDGSLATRTLLKDLDPNVLIDLYYYHGTSFRMLGVLAVFMGVVYALLWCWLHGVVIASVKGVAGSAPEAWRRGLETAAVFSRLLLVAAVVLAAFTALIGSAAWVLYRWTIASPSALLPYAIAAGAAVLWVIGEVFLTAVHDHARIRACAGGSAWAAYRWAWRFVARGGERAFLLAVALQATGFALWIGYQAVGLKVPVTAIVGVTGSLLWGEVFFLARMWMRVWFFAAQSQLQE